MALANPNSVIDVGCGVGCWLQEFQAAGVTDVMGVDHDVPTGSLRIPRNLFLNVDLRNSFKLERRFDLVLCTEVAEHLLVSSASSLVDSLVALGPVVAFSGAIPYQKGGGDHINERWMEYWNELFESRGYTAFDCLRRKVWLDRKVPYWYSQNFLIFVANDKLGAFPNIEAWGNSTNRRALSLVHPRAFLNWTRIIVRHRDVRKTLGTWIVLFIRSFRYTLSALWQAIKNAIWEALTESGSTRPPSSFPSLETGSARNVNAILG